MSKETTRAWQIEDKEPADLRALAARGERLTTFLAGDFWKKDLGPYLKERQAKLAADCIVDPLQVDRARSVMEIIALGTTSNSGRHMEIGHLLEELAIWTEDGKNASAELGKREGEPKDEANHS